MISFLLVSPLLWALWALTTCSPEPKPGTVQAYVRVGGFREPLAFVVVVWYLILSCSWLLRACLT